MTANLERPWRGDPCEIVAATVGTSGLMRVYIAALDPWRAEAVCNGTPAAVFFPEVGGSSQLAFEYCGRCTVREQCLDEAMAEAALDYGIRGGMTAQARKARRRLEQKRTTTTPRKTT